jgi:excisionase family DNA binding protein
MSAKQAPAPQQSRTDISLAPRGLRVKEAAAYLGVTPFFIRDSVWKNELPAMKLGRRLIIAREDLDKFIDRQKTRCAA